MAVQAQPWVYQPLWELRWGRAGAVPAPVQSRGLMQAQPVEQLLPSEPHQCCSTKPWFPFPQLRPERGINREKGVACLHPGSTPTASGKALPRVQPLLPTAVTSDPYYFCKVEQGRKNGCAVSFFMRQDLLRTIGEINPSM